MNIPVYVTKDEVKRVCIELDIRDWTMLESSEVLLDEATTILSAMDITEMTIDTENFRQGLEVELEHGIRFIDANITNNHPILTGKIVLAHFKESLDYYKRLDVAEIEGDLLKALIAKNIAKVETLYKKLVQARFILSQTENSQLL